MTIDDLLILKKKYERWSYKNRRLEKPTEEFDTPYLMLKNAIDNFKKQSKEELEQIVELINYIMEE